jgi:osmotically inducible protein OsmC
MAFTHILGEAGFTANSVDTSAGVHQSSVDGGFAITRIDLITRADVPDIDRAQFAKLADAARSGCVVSTVMNNPPCRLAAEP